MCLNSGWLWVAPFPIALKNSFPLASFANAPVNRVLHTDLALSWQGTLDQHVGLRHKHKSSCIECCVHKFFVEHAKHIRDNTPEHTFLWVIRPILHRRDGAAVLLVFEAALAVVGCKRPNLDMKCCHRKPCVPQFWMALGRCSSNSIEERFSTCSFCEQPREEGVSHRFGTFMA